LFHPENPVNPDSDKKSEMNPAPSKSPPVGETLKSYMLTHVFLYETKLKVLPTGED
jgi:hypothetical protein